MSISLPGHHLLGVAHPFADDPESFMQPAPPLLAPAEALAPTAPEFPLVALAPLLAPVPELLAEALLPRPVAEAPAPAVPLHAPEPLAEPAAANAALDSARAKVNALDVIVFRAIPGPPWIAVCDRQRIVKPSKWFRSAPIDPHHDFN
jgi:hypothetical protein